MKRLTTFVVALLIAFCFFFNGYAQEQKPVMPPEGKPAAEKVETQKKVEKKKTTKKKKKKTTKKKTTQQKTTQPTSEGLSSK